MSMEKAYELAHEPMEQSKKECFSSKKTILPKSYLEGYEDIRRVFACV